MSIELKSVSYTYAEKTPYCVKALDDISITFDKGEFIGIMGRTGCGKSTLTQIIDGLLAPDCGEVLLDGENINSKRYNRRILREKVGVLFQFPDYQLFETTVERDVAFSLKHSGLSKNEIQSRVSEALNAVGFDYYSVKDKSPLSFSGGEKRRVAIAGVLAARPEYLILDEPVAGLDPMGRTEFLKLLKRLNRGGTAIIMISHNTDALAECASRIVLIDNGRVIHDGRVDEILSDSQLLESSGLHSGQVCSIARRLRENSVDISDKVIKYNQLLDEILRVCGGNGI